MCNVIGVLLFSRKFPGRETGGSFGRDSGVQSPELESFYSVAATKGNTLASVTFCNTLRNTFARCFRVPDRNSLADALHTLPYARCRPLSGNVPLSVRPLLSRSPGVPVDRRSLQDKPANLRRRYTVSHRPEQSGDRALDKIDGSLTGANTPKARMGNVAPVVGMGCAMDTRN